MSCRDGPNDRVDLWRSLCTSLLYFVLRVKKVHVRYISSADEFLVKLNVTNTIRIDSNEPQYTVDIRN